MSPMVRLFDQDALAPRLLTTRLPRSLQSSLRRRLVTDEHVLGVGVWLGVGSALVLLAGAFMGLWLVVAGFVMLVLPVAVAGVVRRDYRERRVVVGLPDLVVAVARALRSGASLVQALNEAADSAPRELADEMQQILATTGRGRPSAEAFQEWVDRMPRPEVRLVAAALALASENESGAAKALEGVSHALRDRSAVDSEVRALAAQASASMRALLLLPVGFLLLDLLSRRETLTYLFSSRLGRLFLASGVVLNLAGALWMRRLVARHRTVT